MALFKNDVRNIDKNLSTYYNKTTKIGETYMTLEEILVKFGFDHKEAKIYLAALELGPATVLQISKRAEVKRPTTYVLLDQMVGQGYFTKTYKNSKLLYNAETPETLLHTIHNKENMLLEAIPFLSAIMATTKERPKIKIYEGIAGMKQVYADIYASDEISFFGSINNIQIKFAEILEDFQKLLQKRKIIVRDLLTHHLSDIAYAKTVIGQNYEIRILPKELNFSIDCAIYNNKIAILAVTKDLFAVVIESKDVADSFRALHALAWQSATPLEKIL